MSIDIREIVNKAPGAEGPLYLASIVDTDGPCYRKTGGRLLVGARGRLAGSVSGGCLERDLVKRMGWFTESGPRLETFNTSADGDEDGRSYIGCGGSLRVLLEQIDSATIKVLSWVAEQRMPCAIVTVLKSDDPEVRVGAKYAASKIQGVGESTWSPACQTVIQECLSKRAHLHRTFDTSAGQFEALVEYVPTPRRLLVAGRNYDSGPMVRMARETGWEVCLATDRGEANNGADHQISLTPKAVGAWVERHPHGAVVIMTHSIPLDRMCLETTLRLGKLPYVAVLGPRDRTEKLLAAIEDQGALPEDALDTLHSPAGIKLGGEGAAAIALSILAELEMTFAYRIPKQ